MVLPLGGRFIFWDIFIDLFYLKSILRFAYTKEAFENH